VQPCRCPYPALLRAVSSCGRTRQKGLRCLDGRRTGTKYAHTPRDFLDRQVSILVICHNGKAWHGRGFRFFRILNESRAAVSRDRPQPGGSIAIATAQNNTHNSRAVGLGSRNEQWIGGGTRVVDFRPLTQSAAIVLQNHMVVGRCHVDMPGLNQNAVTSEACRT
jgi:hypothetical protein